MAKVSIVVPVYNSQEWIEKCVTSLIKQTETDIEIILVDDKSTDRSLDICERLSDRDNRIKVICKENGGPHSARKAGTRDATADYVMYVDSDDWIDSDMVERMLKKLLENDCECILCGLIVHYPDNTITSDNKIVPGKYHGDKITEELYKKMLCPEESFEQRIQPSLCGKIFLTEKMRVIMEELDEDIWIGEDLACTMLYILNSKKVLVDNQIHGYHYEIRDNSITTRYDSHYFDKVVRLSTFLEKNIEKMEMNFFRQNIIYFEIYLLYRQIGIAINAKDKSLFWQYVKNMERAVNFPLYVRNKKYINWKKFKVSKYEKLLLYCLFYKIEPMFEVLCYILFLRRKKFR